MSNTKHTPGPWFIGGRVTGHGIGIHVTTISSGLVASVGDNDARCAGLHKMYASQHYDNDLTRIEVMEANARLIAAAPELLDLAVITEQLSGLAPWVGDPEMKKLLLNIADNARTLIAKATNQ